MSEMSLAVIGLGTMGRGMACKARQGGARVIAYNRSKDVLGLLLESGIEPASSPAEAVSETDAVVLTVSDDAALRDVSEGPTGFLSRLRRGATVINAGTHGITLVRDLAAQVEARGAYYLDAPITGSKIGAETGSLVFIVGGAKETLENVSPLLAAMGKRVVHVGTEIGAGQAAKYCLNLAQAVSLQGMLEAYGLGLRLGVSIEALAEVIANSAAGSGLSNFKTPFLMREDYAPHFKLALMRKDLLLALATADEHSLALPAAQSVVGLYEQAIAAGLGAQDFLATAVPFGRSLGVRWKPQND